MSLGNTKPLNEIDPRFKLEYKAYYHVLYPGPDGLRCFGSNLPDHPKGSCLNPDHPLVYPNGKKRKEEMEAWADSLDKEEG